MITQHHTHYKEIDGYDEIKLIPTSEHVKHHKSIGKQMKHTEAWYRLNNKAVQVYGKPFYMLEGEPFSRVMDLVRKDVFTD